MALVLGVALGAPAPARAYVLPADYLIKLLVEKRRGQRIEDLSIRMRTEREGRDGSFEEHLYLGQPAKARRVEENGDEKALIYLEREGVVATGTEGSLRRRSGPPSDLIATLLVPGTSELDAIAQRVLGLFKQLGIDTSITTYGRDEGDLVYIIGARAWEPDRPQVWLDKDTYLPVRLVVDRPEGGKKVREETRLLEYGSELTHEWFPRVIEVYRKNELVARSEVTEIKLNQSLPDTLFELPRR